jgi:hypothetical protein
MSFCHANKVAWHQQESHGIQLSPKWYFAQQYQNLLRNFK